MWTKIDLNESLRQELKEQSPIAPTTALPDLYTIREPEGVSQLCWHRVLKEWKVAKRAENKECFREFADRIIEKLISDDTGHTMLNRLLSDLQQERWRE